MEIEYKDTLDIIKKKKRRLIFSVTSGRSGTAYLASIFGYAKDVHATHEPAPEFAEVMRDIQKDPKKAKYFLLEKKLPKIITNNASVYVETSHITCKGFLEPLLKLGILPDLIIHRRLKRDVALSMYQMGTIPARSDKGMRFYLSPKDPGVLRIRDWQNLNDYQLCYWYCLEIERRAQYYKKIFQKRGARISETTLSGLKTFDGLQKCFSDLHLQVKKPEWITRIRFKRSARIKVNESRETKKNLPAPKNITELENEVKERIIEEAGDKYDPGALSEILL